MNRPAFAVLLIALLLAACGGGGKPAPTPTPTPTDTATPAPTSTPVPRATIPVPNTEPAPEIDLPDGFQAFVVAEEMSAPTSIARHPDGTIYVSQLAGPVLRLEDGDGDGLFERGVAYTESFDGVNGIAFSPDGVLYVSSTGRIITIRDTNSDGVGDAVEEIITGLPNDQHQNNGLAFGPDGKLYITNGSTCDECIEADERSATILQANPDGSELRVFASGLRNSYDLAFDPLGRLWATDNGSDGEDPPFCASIDELNLVEDGNDYGWPYGATCDPQSSGTPPAASLGLHTGSTGIAYNGQTQFPQHVYGGDLFLTLWGVFVGEPDRPQGLYRASIGEHGGALSAEIEEFGLGFARPIDVVIDRDGTLLALDFGTGRLYRIVYLEDGVARRVN